MEYHALFAPLYGFVERLALNHDANSVREWGKAMGGRWDPDTFVTLCNRAIVEGSPELTDFCRVVSTLEIELLLEAVAQRMTGGSGSALQDDLLLVLPALRFDERAARPRL